MGLKLIGELGLDGTGFARGLGKAESLAAAAGSRITAAIAGLVGVGTISLAITKTIQSAGELVNACERLGLGAAQVQVLRKAAMDAGVEFGKLEKSFDKIDVARRKALTPGQQGADMRRTFAQLGANPDMLRSMTAAQLFMGPLANAARSYNPGQVKPLLEELGLRDFGAMIAVLKTNFAELADAMKKYGGLLDSETAVKLKHLGDGFTLLAQIMTTQLGPALVAFAERAYRALLLLGKGVASYSGSLGGGSAHQGPVRAVATALGMIDATLIAGGAGLLFGKTAANLVLDAGAKITGFNPVAGAAGAETAAEPWEARLSQFEALVKKWAEQAKALDNQQAPDGGFEGAPPKANARSLQIPSDSLTRVGNFLGGSQNAIMRLAEQRTQYLRQIAANTAHRGGGRTMGNPGAMPGDPMGVFIPTH